MIQLLIAFILPIITGLLSYLAARSKSKDELTAVKINSQTEIDKIVKASKEEQSKLKDQYDHELQMYKEQSKMEINNINTKFKHELEMLKESSQVEIDKLKAQSEINSEAQNTDHINNFTKDLFSEMLSNPEEALKKFESLKSLSEIYKN